MGTGSREENALIISSALAGGVSGRGRRLRFLAAFGSRQQPLALALPHVLVVLRGPGARRRVRGYSADRRRNGVADTGRQLLVDGAAAAQAAAREGKRMMDLGRSLREREGRFLLTGPFYLYNRTNRRS